jgi:hypothetical protein
MIVMSLKTDELLVIELISQRWSITHKGFDVGQIVDNVIPLLSGLYPRCILELTCPIRPELLHPHPIQFLHSPAYLNSIWLCALVVWECLYEGSIDIFFNVIGSRRCGMNNNDASMWAMSADIFFNMIGSRRWGMSNNDASMWAMSTDIFFNVIGSRRWGMSNNDASMWAMSSEQWVCL